LPEQNSPRQVEMNLADCQREGAVERTLIWARRILCWFLPQIIPGG